MNFTTFRLESKSLVVDCGYDYVSVYDGGVIDPKHLIGTFCDINPVPSMRSTYNELTVVFRSDYSFVMPGFRIVITEHDQRPNCKPTS